MIVTDINTIVCILLCFPLAHSVSSMVLRVFMLIVLLPYGVPSSGYINLFNYSLAPEQSQFLTIETNNAINIFMYISFIEADY